MEKAAEDDEGKNGHSANFLGVRACLQSRMLSMIRRRNMSGGWTAPNARDKSQLPISPAFDVATQAAHMHVLTPYKQSLTGPVQTVQLEKSASRRLVTIEDIPMICTGDLQTSLLLHGAAPPMAPHLMHHQRNAGKRAKTRRISPASRPSRLREEKVPEWQMVNSHWLRENDAKSINHDNITGEKHPAHCSKTPGKDGFGVGGCQQSR
ncbi:hypothetical protein BBK36DRAFT_165346 [Trichoderma citrinoviride]|uniref:Uncharacterized protein n=1 Tax=Trichoderma citrinoviride TaxID=58853 RepID=A0A2T4B7D6_9HYPO|nr:hypothetical protein BBK36DRAFT_165346 [Trichoderma citrinoviride]PTB65139.1 hypothetical protein BBK36DRAFT_165346 [Trichoderma citrinoviride]